MASVAQLVEQLTLNQLVLGSSPSRGTTFPHKINNSLDCCMDFAQYLPPIPDRRVRFPVTIRHAEDLLLSTLRKEVNGELLSNRRNQPELYEF